LQRPFQSTRPHEARPWYALDARGEFVVSIHAPARGATSPSKPSITAQQSFQSTRPHEARPATWATWAWSRRCFNPRARTRRDRKPSSVGFCWNQVSIHAPARGATMAFWRDASDDIVSIHAPARGATGQSAGGGACGSFQSTRPHEARRPQSAALRAGQGRFNPRARTRRDSLAIRKTSSAMVSIHAPARGATKSVKSDAQRAYVSIHAPARGATPTSCRNPAIPRSFNPRARTRRDR